VFTELVERFGVRGVEFREMYGTDEDCFAGLGPVRGLIFLFKWSQPKEPRECL
jgi:ubiquitin carboxyl-terminal hydrolase L5